MIHEAEIRAKLIDVLQGKTSLEAFADWLSVARVNAHLDSSQAAQGLAAAVAAALYAYFESHMTELALLDELFRLISRVPATINTAGAGGRVVTASTASSQ